jgi:predicted AlkP superfamily phosphohydrolase/phosphomutase
MGKNNGPDAAMILTGKDGMACGPDIKGAGARLSGLKIYDIASTVLDAFAVPMPDDMDGGVLLEIFRRGTGPALT